MQICHLNKPTLVSRIHPQIKSVDRKHLRLEGAPTGAERLPGRGASGRRGAAARGREAPRSRAVLGC